MQFFWANISGFKTPQCFCFVEIKKQHCSLHGECVRYLVMGNRIKISGNVEGMTSPCALDSLTHESREALKPLIDRMEIEG